MCLFFILTSSLMFPWCRRLARSRSLPCGIAFDCGRLLEITTLLPGHHWTFSIYRFINCNNWTIIFFQFKFSLTILCSIRQSVVTVTNLCLHTGSLTIYLLLISYLIFKQPRVTYFILFTYADHFMAQNESNCVCSFQNTFLEDSYILI